MARNEDLPLKVRVLLSIESKSYFYDDQEVCLGKEDEDKDKEEDER